MPQSRRCYTYYNRPPRGTTRKFFGYFRTFLVFFFCTRLEYKSVLWNVLYWYLTIMYKMTNAVF